MTVIVALAPCVSTKLLGEVESVKFAGGGSGGPIETLSKLAVASELVLRLVTASPT